MELDEKGSNREINKIEDKEDKEKTNWKKELFDWIVAIVLAVAVALVVRNFVFTLVKVQGASMEPSLHENDRLFVNRLFYTPEKGDIVIFTPASDPKRPYVKRVIATEGDTVYIDEKEGKVYVNDELLDEPYINEKTHTIGSYIRNLMLEGKYSKDSPIVVPAGHIFAMGDNRNHSKDSRELGPVPVEEIMGGAVFRFWPLDSIGMVHDDAEHVTMLNDVIPVRG